MNITLTVTKYCKRQPLRVNLQGTVPNDYLAIQIKSVRLQQSDRFILSPVRGSKGHKWIYLGREE